MTVRIPKILDAFGETSATHKAGAPGWLPITMYGTDEPARPLIRCNCGDLMGIGLHHVHADGRVTESFYHRDYGEGGPRGCGWHVYLVLEGYDGPEFPPERR
ncbi:MAG: hypothetical protein Q8R28_05480 [Dehalococcoidia bacterium]|nr:hypothetical protein [Dehalococcoidia bacterium]